jgi:hypothetical protein
VVGGAARWGGRGREVVHEDTIPRFGTLDN